MSLERAFSSSIYCLAVPLLRSHHGLRRTTKKIAPSLLWCTHATATCITFCGVDRSRAGSNVCTRSRVPQSKCHCKFKQTWSHQQHFAYSIWTTMDSYYITPPRRTNSLLVGLKRPEKSSTNVCMRPLSQHNHAHHAQRRLEYKPPHQEHAQGNLKFANTQTKPKNVKPRKLRFPPQRPHMVVSHHYHDIIGKCENPSVHSTSGLSRRYEFNNEENIAVAIPQRKRKARQSDFFELPRNKVRKER